MNKWQDFRVRRSNIINLFIDIKQRQLKIKSFIIMINGLRPIQKFADSYNKHKQKVLNKKRLEQAVFVIKHRWKKDIKARKSGIDGIISHWFQSYKLASDCIAPSIEDRAKYQYLLPFLRETAYREQLKNKFRRIRNLLYFITSRFKSVLMLNKAKQVVLKMQWDKTVMKILLNKKEKSSHEMCHKLKRMD